MDFRHVMEQHPLFEKYGAGIVTCLNLIVGMINGDILNLIVAAIGLITLVVTNIYKIVISIISLRELRRNKWKLPEKDDKKIKE